MPQETLIHTSLREFKRLKHLADRAMEQVDDRQFFARLGNEDNSIAVLVKHMAGNMRSRWRDFLTTDGEKPDRDRDSEFVLTSGDTREGLVARWAHGWKSLTDALTNLDETDLDRTVLIRGESLSVPQAINRQLTHYSYHVGQLVLLAKHFAGGQWETLSVPKGGSAGFNLDPTRYLEDDIEPPRTGA